MCMMMRIFMSGMILIELDCFLEFEVPRDV